MNKNSITALLLKQDPPEISKSKVAIEDESQEPAQDSSLEIIDDGESIPYNYILECKKLLDDLEPRLQPDIYRGILLEVV